ncbi:tetratricopeptide repeat protein 5 [Microtus ochrogaster]|uniref:Tetratricopeptide repeat protein 5 n=1 Tax=Microtus ochrogaster TaxID=79684 RepID=A0ABM1TVH6_MICOH|nr:tetratricopeptide repeat protein 5 [Microtus ochrogaster]
MSPLPTPASQEPSPTARTKSPCRTCQWCFGSCRPSPEMSILVMSWTASGRPTFLFIPSFAFRFFTQRLLTFLSSLPLLERKKAAIDVIDLFIPLQEKVDRKASSNPDLHLNRATLHKYEESYGEALEGFSQAAALDPAWPEPRQREQQLMEFLTRLTSLLESKGKTKPKKLQSMLGSLRPGHLGPCGDGRYQSASGQKVTLERKPLSSLQPGVNSGAVVLGKVVFSLTAEEKVPFTFGLVDSDGPCYAVMVYNVVQSWGVLIGDSVAIPEPNLRHHQIQHKGKNYSFSSVRVETPLLLVVNGKPQNSSSQATATVASRPQCE